MLAAAAVAIAGCGAARGEVPDALTASVVANGEALARASTADVPELEVRGDGLDRFAFCPPPGELGQAWTAPPAEWVPSGAASVQRDPAAGSTGRGAGEIAAMLGMPRVHADERGPARTERLYAITRDEYQRCWDTSTLLAPAQVGRVAMVVRVASDGRVAKVESHAACAMPPAAIRCMRAVAADLRFDPPPEGHDTVVVPFVHGRPSGPRRDPTPSDAYTNAAYVRLDALRPTLHACEREAARAGRTGFARATFALEIDGRGHVTRVAAEAPAGDEKVLACVTHALEDAHFDPPAALTGHVTARIVVNPQLGPSAR